MRSSAFAVTFATVESTDDGHATTSPRDDNGKATRQHHDKVEAGDRTVVLTEVRPEGLLYTTRNMTFYNDFRVSFTLAMWISNML